MKTTKKLNLALKEYKEHKAIKDFNPTLCYNFLSNYYYVFYFYSKEFIQKKFSKSFEIII